MDRIIIFDKQKIKLNKEITTVGRGPECDIHLNDEQVSRSHGKFIRKGDDLFYEDNKSSNGSYLNNKLVTARKKIKEGDVIQISSFVLKVDLEIPTKRYPALESDQIKNKIGCPNCGKTVSKDALFCVFCGTALKKLVKQNTLPCPECGKIIPIGSKYCNFCGVDLSIETYDLDLTEITPVFMPIPAKGKTTDELSTIPLDELVKPKKQASKKTKGKTLIPKKKQKSIAPKSKTSSIKVKSISIKSQKPSIKTKNISVKAKSLSTGTKSQSLKIDKKQIKIEDVKSLPKAKKKLKTISASKPAGFGVRAIALIFDSLFFLILCFVLFVGPAYFLNPFKIDFTKGINLNLLREIHHNIRLETYLGLAAGVLFLALLYFVAGTALRGGTLGKKIFGIAVFKKKTMTSPIGWWRAVIRTSAYIASIAILFIGFLISLLNKEKRTLHDYISGTQVSYKK